MSSGPRASRPAQPRRVGRARSGRPCRRRTHHYGFGSAPTSLSHRAIRRLRSADLPYFGLVVVDQLHVGELGRLGRQRRRLVRRHLELLGLRLELLRLGRQRPVIELLGVRHVARALDDAHRADLVARAFAGRRRLHREAGQRLGDAVMHEADRHHGLAARHRLHRRRARAGVGVDVGVHLLQVVERLVLAHAAAPAWRSPRRPCPRSWDWPSGSRP